MTKVNIRDQTKLYQENLKQIFLIFFAIAFQLALVLGLVKAGAAAEAPNTIIGVMYWAGAIIGTWAVPWLIIIPLNRIAALQSVPNIIWLILGFLISLPIAREIYVAYVKFFDVAFDINFGIQFISFNSFLKQFHHAVFQNLTFGILWLLTNFLVLMILMPNYTFAERLRNFLLRPNLYLCWLKDDFTVKSKAPLPPPKTIPELKELILAMEINSLAEIEWLKSEDHYLLGKVNGHEKIAYGRFGQTVALLKPYGFIRCHRSWAVRLSAVSDWHDDDYRSLLMGSGDIVPISRSYRVTISDVVNDILTKS